MTKSRLYVTLLRYTQNPEEVIAQAAKLCYTSASVNELEKHIKDKDQSSFIEKLIDMGHLSPIEHATFTFGIEGVSRVCSHQIVRHRLASYSQQSQRYVGQHGKKGGGFNFIVPPSVEKAGREQWFIEKMMVVQEWYDELVDVLEKNGETSFEDARFCCLTPQKQRLLLP